MGKDLNTVIYIITVEIVFLSNDFTPQKTKINDGQENILVKLNVPKYFNKLLLACHFCILEQSKTGICWEGFKVFAVLISSTYKLLSDLL